MKFVDQMWQNEIDSARIMEADIISSTQGGRTDGRVGGRQGETSIHAFNISGVGV